MTSEEVTKVSYTFYYSLENNNNHCKENTIFLFLFTRMGLQGLNVFGILLPTTFKVYEANRGFFF